MNNWPYTYAPGEFWRKWDDLFFWGITKQSPFYPERWRKQTIYPDNVATFLKIGWYCFSNDMCWRKANKRRKYYRTGGLDLTGYACSVVKWRPKRKKKK